MASTIDKRRSMRLSMLQKRVNDSGDGKSPMGSFASLASGTTVSGGSGGSDGRRRSSYMLRMHDSIQSAISNWATELEEEDSSLFDEQEDEESDLNDNFDAVESQLEKEEEDDEDPVPPPLSYKCQLQEQPKPYDPVRVSGTTNTQGSTASSFGSNESPTSAALTLPTLVATKSVGLSSLGSLPPRQGTTATTRLSDYRECLDDERLRSAEDDAFSHSSAAGSSHHRPSTRPSKRLLPMSSEQSLHTRRAPESGKLRGASGVTASTIASPLPTQLAQLGLFGRDKQVQQLHQALHNCLWEKEKSKSIYSKHVVGVNNKKNNKTTTPITNKQVIWIEGVSGSGKTALAEHALRDRVQRQGGLFVMGKFENKLERTSSNKFNEQPLAGFSSACDDLCVQLLAMHEQRQEEYQDFLQGLEEQMEGEESELLLGLLPGLRPILESTVEAAEDAKSSSDDENAVQQEAEAGAHTCTQAAAIKAFVRETVPYSAEEAEQQSKDHFQFVFRKFVRLVASFFPLVLVLDDLQWADSGSLELLEVLALDPISVSNLMLVGCYRDDEIDEEHHIRSIQKEVEGSTALGVMHIRLKNLDTADLNLLLSELLQKDPSDTQALANTCYRKCGGNAFYLVRFITMLWQEKLIKFDIMAGSWTWDDNEIAERSKATENVVNFLHGQLASLPESTRQLLLFASCLGTEFEISTMTLIMEDFYPGTPFQKDVDRCVIAGVLETTGETGYRWIHDKLMEAAQTLLSPDELSKLKYCVGAVLLKSLEKTNQEGDLFVIANLLNEAPSMSDTPISLAELNLRAAKRAASLSSFYAAAEYCSKGISLLPDSKWETYFDLTLQLYSLAGDLYNTLGEFEAMKIACSEVISRRDVDIVDKVLSYQCMMDNICFQGDPAGAITMCLDVLGQLDVTFPRNSIQVGLKIKYGLSNAASEVDSRCEQLQKLPLLQDAKHKAAMRFLSRLGTFGYMAKSPMLPLANLKLAKYSLKYGLGNDSPKNIACIGMMVAAFGNNLQDGSKYGMTALEVMERLPVKRRVLPEVHFMAYAHVLHNTQPVHQMMKPLLNSYNVALEFGSALYACFSIYHYILFAFRSGKPLRAIETDLRAYTVQMADMHMQKPLGASKMLWQLVMNLMGFDGTSPLVLTGQAMDEVEFLSSMGSDAYFFTKFQCFQNVLFALLGKHELGAELAISKADMTAVHPGSPAIVMDVFYQGLSCYAVARASGKKKYSAHAKKMQKKIDDWAKQGNPNILHFASFLSAERAALRGKKQEAEKFYETAIVTASKQGFLQDAALANERLAEFHEHILEDKSSAGFRYQEAIRLYGEWGALHKVKTIQNAKAELLRWCTASSHPEEVRVDFGAQMDSRSLGCSSKGSRASSFGIL